MTLTGKYDRIVTGIAAGILLPVAVAFVIYLFSPGDLSLPDYIEKISRSGIITHTISLSVFSNILVFMLFSRLDMLKACRGVLAITILWAIIVFAIKIL
jgi:hypothetical protein